jgi:hypothetical protein
MLVTLRRSSDTQDSASSEKIRSAAADIRRNVALLRFLRPRDTTKVPMLVLQKRRRLLKSVLIVVMQQAARAYLVLAKIEFARVSCNTSTCRLMRGAETETRTNDTMLW